MSKLIYIALIIIILVGVWLRLEYLNRPMHLDESITVVAFASEDLPSVVANYTEPNNQILHTIFVHLMYHHVGKSPVLIRLPAFIFGILLIPMTYVVSRCFYDWRVGILTTTLVATNPILIIFSVNARGYTLLINIVLILLWLAHQLKSQDNTLQWLLFGLFSALGFYTIPTMIYPMGFIALWLLVAIYRENTDENRIILIKNYIVALILGATLTVILYSLPLYFSGLQGIRTQTNALSIPYPEFFWKLPMILWQAVTTGILIHMPFVFVVFCTIAFIVGAITDRKLAKDKFPLIIPIVMWILLVLSLQHVQLPGRVWTFFVPIYLMFASVGVVRWLPANIPSYSYNIIIVIFCAVMAVFVRINNAPYESPYLGYAPDAELAAYYLDEILQPQDTYLLVYPSSYTIFYYADYHDLNFWQPDFTSTNTETSTGTTYVFYHHGYEMRQMNHFFPGALDNATVVQEFPHSVLKRTIYGD